MKTCGHCGTVNSSDLQAAESLATTYSKILGSNSVLDAVVNDVNRTESEKSLERKDLAEMIKVSVITDTQLLEVVVSSTDPEYACKIAGSFGRVAPREIVRITKAGGVELVEINNRRVGAEVIHHAGHDRVGGL